MPSTRAVRLAINERVKQDSEEHGGIASETPRQEPWTTNSEEYGRGFRVGFMLCFVLFLLGMIGLALLVAVIKVIG